MSDEPIIYVPKDVFSPIESSPNDELGPEKQVAIEAHISRAEVNHGLGKFIVEYPLLESAIKEMIGFLLKKTDWTAGFIVTAE
jgi:hypothetical protein